MSSPVAKSPREVLEPAQFQENNELYVKGISEYAVLSSALCKDPSLKIKGLPVDKSMMAKFLMAIKTGVSKEYSQYRASYNRKRRVARSNSADTTFTKPNLYTDEAVRLWLEVYDQGRFKGNVLGSAGKGQPEQWKSFDFSPILERSPFLGVGPLGDKGRGLSIPLSQLYMLIIYTKLHGSKPGRWPGSMDMSQDSIFTKHLKDVMGDIFTHHEATKGEKIAKALAKGKEYKDQPTTMTSVLYTGLPSIIWNARYNNKLAGAYDNALQERGLVDKAQVAVILKAHSEELHVAINQIKAWRAHLKKKK
jgi:hypothetical protein